MKKIKFFIIWFIKLIKSESIFLFIYSLLCNYEYILLNQIEFASVRIGNWNEIIWNVIV